MEVIYKLSRIKISLLLYFQNNFFPIFSKSILDSTLEFFMVSKA